MNLQILGGLLPKNNSCADNLWSIAVDVLPDEFKTYIIGDTRMAHHCYVVLSAILLDQLFPDPDLACYAAKVNQRRFCQWWSDFLRATLINQEVDFSAYKDARNRADLCAAIRLREPSLAARVTQGLELDPLASSPGLAPADDDSSDIFADNGCTPGKLRPNPQARTTKFSELIPPFPSLVYGGPRYLHSARKFLLSQIEILSDNQLFCVDNIWKDITVTKELEVYATFGQCVTMAKLHFPSISPFLAADPDLEVMFFSARTGLNSHISQYARDCHRDSRLVALEWLRTRHPDEIQTVILRASEEGGSKRERRLWFSSLGKYDEAKTMLRNLTGMDPPTCTWAERRIDSYLENATSKAETVLQTLTQLQRQAEERVEALHGLASSEPTSKRTRMDDFLPPLPLLPRMKTQAQRERKQRKVRGRREKKRQEVLQRILAARKSSAPCATVTSETPGHLACPPAPGLLGDCSRPRWTSAPG